MDFEALRVPDHSVLTWNLALAESREVHAQRVRSGVEGGTNRHLIVPRGYLTGEEAAINWIAEEFQSMDKDQVKLDDVYANLMEAERPFYEPSMVLHVTRRLLLELSVSVLSSHVRFQILGSSYQFN